MIDNQMCVYERQMLVGSVYENNKASNFLETFDMKQGIASELSFSDILKAQVLLTL